MQSFMSIPDLIILLSILDFNKMEEEPRFIKYHLIILFMIVLLLPLFNTVTGTWTFERADENRRFRDSLDFDIQNLDPFPRECEAYVNDNFSFRTPALDVFHLIKYHIFKISPNPKKTLIGRDGWCFLAGDEMDQYEGKQNFTEEELKLFLGEWQRRKNYLDARDIKCYWLIAPTKHSIYSEYLPFSIPKPKVEKRVDQLKNYFQDSLPNLIIDPTPELIAAKNEYKVYYQLDNHWTSRGALVAVELLCSRIVADFPEAEVGAFPPFSWKDQELAFAFHHNVLGIKGLSEIESFPSVVNPQSKEAVLYNFPEIEWFPIKDQFEKRYVNPHLQSGLRVLFIRDSYGTRTIPLVKELFSESIFVFDAWMYRLNEEIIKEVKPDIVVFLSVESKLQRILEHK